jgi:hypothetical protein
VHYSDLNDVTLVAYYTCKYGNTVYRVIKFFFKVYWLWNSEETLKDGGGIRSKCLLCIIQENQQQRHFLHVYKL